MNSALLAGAICFTITGFGIPLYGTQLVFEQGEHPMMRVFFGFLVVVWCVALSISVSGLIDLAAKPAQVNAEREGK